MDFKNVNPLNSRVNKISGNLFPITTNKSQFSVTYRIYSAIVWLIELIYMIGLISGLILSPAEKILKDGILSIVVIMETSFMLTCLYLRTKLMKEIIHKINNILQNADETMKNIINSKIKPITMPFVIYGVTSVISVGIWHLQPLVLVFEKSTFVYADYNLPTAFSPEPFSSLVLIPSTVIAALGGIYLFLKKFSVDIYMMHLVLMLTAQYRYTATKLKMLFQNLQDYHYKSEETHIPVKAQSVKKELKELCHHQNAVLKISCIVKELLSINFSILHINNVFRFCFLGIFLSTIPSMTFPEAASVVFFAIGSLLQFFLLCSSVQTLLDASTEVTDKAFNEGWYEFEPSVQRTFILLIMANNLECRIAAIGRFDLSLPSFMTIINQSYSIALLFLRAK
ncbi:PREDICTED: uncharacterized protein LOC105569858 [Vollenhovia emeryi]|uniref:uncharacterized protein LOC105569858 n=1 Tax=Vollenhovia emeryi TaxID=411798 RepID=UPI0005F41A86|nr:PREDICTED: uncharacterized protein LOC105569858 [Vollenhovia emeryi]